MSVSVPYGYKIVDVTGAIRSLSDIRDDLRKCLLSTVFQYFDYYMVRGLFGKDDDSNLYQFFERLDSISVGNYPRENTFTNIMAEKLLGVKVCLLLYPSLRGRNAGGVFRFDTCGMERFHDHWERFLNVVEQTGYFIPYGYWDDVEKDEDVSSKEWRKRHKFWYGTGVSEEVTLLDRGQFFASYVRNRGDVAEWKRLSDNLRQMYADWKKEVRILKGVPDKYAELLKYSHIVSYYALEDDDPYVAYYFKDAFYSRNGLKIVRIDYYDLYLRTVDGCDLSSVAGEWKGLFCTDGCDGIMPFVLSACGRNMVCNV